MKKGIIIFIMLLIFFNLFSKGKSENIYERDFIFPNSDKKKLILSDIYSIYAKYYNAKTLAIARNEIYARKGYRFKSEKYKKYFSKKKWYKPVADNRLIKLNNVENYNINLLKYLEYRLKTAKPYHPKKRKRNYIVLKKNIKAFIDLDGNGIKDTITYKIDDKHERYWLTVNDTTITGRGEALIDSIAVVDIEKRDRLKEIVISEKGPSDDYLSRIFFYFNSKIEKTGEISGLFCYGLQFDNSGRVIANTRGSILQTWFFDVTYYLNENHKLIKIPNQIYKTDSPVFLKQELKIFEKRDEKSNYIILKPFTYANIIGTDDKKWCLIKTIDGRKGWFYVENYFYVNGTGILDYNIFHGLGFAD